MFSLAETWALAYDIRRCATLQDACTRPANLLIEEQIMKERPPTAIAWILAVFCLAFGSAVHAACSNPVTLPTCIESGEFSADPGFDLHNSCGDFAVSINVKAEGLDFTFNLPEGETMLGQIQSEIPSRDLQTMTNAYKDGSLFLMCCPEFSQYTRCQALAE